MVAGVEVESGTEDLVIDRCIVRECFGDGVRLVGTDQPDRIVRRVRIENCLFQRNKRSGLGIQRAIEQIVVVNCHFDAIFCSDVNQLTIQNNTNTDWIPK
jgi:hypothetical protein